ncbi:hypothetical protein TIFTF001_000332 [Ficus carica]|uniref:Uncharacterized protein n=1 Tax=Ficus carica TaxID=3494 RepID=A0AA87YVB7_FICCA|nr:hypothetical protein TIFTF001_000332 [Ficus carica]
MHQTCAKTKTYRGLVRFISSKAPWCQLQQSSTGGVARARGPDLAWKMSRRRGNYVGGKGRSGSEFGYLRASLRGRRVIAIWIWRQSGELIRMGPLRSGFADEGESSRGRGH